MHANREARPLPVSTGSFSTIRRNDLLYVDKTRQIAFLVGPENKYLFLARPRRFGKTLLVSTLESLFLGKRELFSDTWILQTEWPWVPHKVVRLDMTAGRTENARSLEIDLRWQIARLFQAHDLVSPSADMGVQVLFSELIGQLSTESGQGVVVLIDEYDAPIIQNLEHPAVLSEIRDFLRGFYGILKVRDEDLRFVFLTGVTRFARTSIFSGLNNLRDISILPACSDLVGFTERELEIYLDPHLEAMAQSLSRRRQVLDKQLREWYDGYLFAEGGIQVYNPYSVLNCLQNQKFGNYWADSGTPVFLTRLLARQRRSLQEMLGLGADGLLTAAYDVENPDLSAVMYQTGYLTIKASGDCGHETTMPNREVKQTFLQSLLETYAQGSTKVPSLVQSLVKALGKRDFEAFFAYFNSLLQQIPYEVQEGRERYFQMLLHLVFTLLGYRTESERSTHRGRLDTVVEMKDAVIILEYKLDGTANAALLQIEERGYPLPYQAQGKSVIGLGVNFDSRTRTVAEWKSKDMSTATVPPPSETGLSL